MLDRFRPNALLAAPARTAHLRVSLLGAPSSAFDGPTREFHLLREARDAHAFDDSFFSVRGDVVFANLQQAQRFAHAVNAQRDKDDAVRPAQVNAMGLVHEVFHLVLEAYRKSVAPNVFAELGEKLRRSLGERYEETLRTFVERYPPPAVYRGEITAEAYLAQSSGGISNRDWTLEELVLLWLTNQNPGYAPIGSLVTDAALVKETAYLEVIRTAQRHFDEDAPRFGPADQSLLDMLLAPIRHAPHSLESQIEFMRSRWGVILSEYDYLFRLLLGLDFLSEEGRWFWRKTHGVGADDSLTPAAYRGELYEYEPEQFSPDLDWMPRVVMLAKSSFVWLDQLSKRYGRHIQYLSDIPDEELDTLKARGFTALWLIGLWRRSEASRKIKHKNGNPDAVASAYSLYDYEIAPELGGHAAYENLRERAWKRGIRLASDMVPNHVGIDGRWVIEHPDWFVQMREPPFPNYTFNGPDLSDDDRVGLYIEDGYWSKTDAAVVFKRVDKHTGDTRYIYHGNDGTSMPWNDTAQLNYLVAEVREAVIQTILHVARMFPVIRFDAAMTLAKRHYQRLWFPIPGSGGDIPSRAQFALTRERFDEVFPNEFWREVVDRVAVEAPDTLLLAEAFWMMEGYFVRTLGMHRVYNSAFMNMLKKEENSNFRLTIKNVLEFNPQILKRHVNFMNNPDEETAVAQFGKDDKYFGVCLLMSTLPGLPMFGHGQVEGYTERYGMEYKRAYKDEQPDGWLVARHEREIFPLLKRRYLFADVEQFLLFDFFTADGHVDEDVIAYANRFGNERSLVVYHNKWKDTRGWLRMSVAYLNGGGLVQKSLAEGMNLRTDDGVYTILRDHTSGLEYLRANRELWDSGLYVELGAFKYHAFVDVREVEHSKEAPYGELLARIGRGGVPSIEEALVELRFKPVHDPFFEAVNAGSAHYLAGQWDGTKRALSASARVAIEEKLTHVVDGLRYRHPDDTAPAPELIAEVADRAAASLTRALAWRDDVLAAAKRLDEPNGTASPRASDAPLRAASPAPLSTTPKPALAFTPAARDQWLVAGVFLSALEALAPRVDTSYARPLTRTMKFDRVLARAFRGTADDADAARALDLVVLLAEHDAEGAARARLAKASAQTGPKPAARSVEATAQGAAAKAGETDPSRARTAPGAGGRTPLLESTVLAMLQDRAVRDYLRVNVYEATVWFEKERFDRLVEALVLRSGTADGSEVSSADAVTLVTRARAMLEAAAAAGYKLEPLVRWLRDAARASASTPDAAAPSREAQAP